jgi:hypothetical protein
LDRVCEAVEKALLVFLDVEVDVFGCIGGLGYVESGRFVGVVGRVLDVEDDYCCGMLGVGR